MVSLAVFPVIARKSDPISFSVARRLLLALAGNMQGNRSNGSWRFDPYIRCRHTHWKDGIDGCEELERYDMGEYRHYFVSFSIETILVPFCWDKEGCRNQEVLDAF